MKIKEPTERQIKNAKDILKRAGFIPYYWHIDDIDARDEYNGHIGDKLSDKELREIAQNVADNADANYGICWETFDSAIDAVKEARHAK